MWCNCDVQNIYLEITLLALFMKKRNEKMKIIESQFPFYSLPLSLLSNSFPVCFAKFQTNGICHCSLLSALSCSPTSKSTIHTLFYFDL